MAIRNIALLIIMVLSLISGLVQAEQYDAEKWFKTGKQAEIDEAYQAAKDIYLQAIEYHSANPKQYLRIYAKLLNLYKKIEQEEEHMATLQFLESAYPDDTFDTHDRVKLSDLLIKHGNVHKGIQIKEAIVNAGFEKLQAKVYIRVVHYLAKYYADNNETDLKMELFSKVQVIPLAQLDANDHYKLALLYLDDNQKEVGIERLKSIVADFTQTKAARKALFVVAKHYQKAGDCDTAINYYQQYIRDYVEQSFFVQKAYQNIIDCHLQTGRISAADSQSYQLADIVNGVKNSRSLFDLAENLFIQEKHELADSTFLVGLATAQEKLDSAGSLYEKSLTRLHLVRAAYPLGEMTIARQEAKRAVEDLSTLVGLADTATKQNDYLYSQMLLWAAKIDYDFESYSKAREYLETFLDRYPKHNDTHYARYRLIKILLRRWEIEQMKLTDSGKRVEKHNQLIKYAEITNKLQIISQLINGMPISAMRQEVSQWVEYIE